MTPSELDTFLAHFYAAEGNVLYHFLKQKYSLPLLKTKIHNFKK